MTEFYIKNHKKQPLRGKRAVKKKEKKGRLKGTLKKPPLNKKRAPQKKQIQENALFFDPNTHILKPTLLGAVSFNSKVLIKLNQLLPRLRIYRVFFFTGPPKKV